MPTSPLAGLTIIDFSHALAGPYCTMLAAMYGASVIKVEGVDQGDIGRAWGPPFFGSDSAFFLGLNNGKQGVAIDLKHPRGLALCRELVARADVLIENFRPGTMDRLGLGYGAMVELNPRLVYCSISGYGQTGPRRDDPAMDLIVQAAAGLISFTGTPEGSLVRSGHSVADITAGMFALIGILLALRGRDQTGRGSYVDVSMLDGMISAMASSFATFFGTGVPPIPRGTAFATLVPYACFPTRDRDVAIAVSSDKLWKGFCLALERPEWITDPRFAGNGARVENRSVLEPAIAEVLRTRPAAEWLDRFRLHGVPATLVNDLADVAADPQALAREMFPQVSHAVAGSHRVTGAPVKLSDAPAGAGSAAPRLGQDTRSVLRELLGRSDAEVDLLVAEGVVVAPVAVPEARPR